MGYITFFQTNLSTNFDLIRFKKNQIEEKIADMFSIKRAVNIQAVKRFDKSYFITH